MTSGQSIFATRGDISIQTCTGQGSCFDLTFNIDSKIYTFYEETTTNEAVPRLADCDGQTKFFNDLSASEVNICTFFI